MAGLNSWLSAKVMHALGWALIHSLWQCLAIAALAAVLMALSRRPSIRYLVGVGALAAILAAPVATFFVLMAAPATPAMMSNVQVGRQPIVQSPAAAPVPVTPQSRVESSSAPRAWSVMLARKEKQFPSTNLLPWLVAAWLCGVTFFSLRLAGGFLLLEHKRRNQSTIPSAAILALCQDVQRQLGLERAIHYLESGWLQAPAVIGWLRPIVLLPISALTGLSEAQLRAVIAHELAHIRRFDTFVNLFQVLVETLLFYHPGVWWLNKRIRAERELCCDEIALAVSGSRLEYARALTLMAEWESAPRLAMAANRGPLSERIFHILGRKSASAGQRMLGITGSILFLVAALAAANALFVVAAPPMAQARESVKAVLSASQATVAHLAQQVFQASEPEKVSVVAPADTAVPSQAPNDAPRQELAPPAANLSGLPSVENLTTPTVLASNAPPVAKPSDQPIAAPIATERTSSGIASAPGPKAEAEGDQASVPASVPEIKPVVVPNTPSGAGDPDATVCRAPQHIPNSDQFGPQICLHNYEWWKMAMNGKDVATDGKSLIDRPTVRYPKGEGDPDAVTCRTPQILDNGATIARYGPVVCRLNRFWADLIKNRQMVDKYGVIVKLPRGVDYGALYGPGGYYVDPYNDTGRPSQSSATQGSAP